MALLYPKKDFSCTKGARKAQHVIFKTRWHSVGSDRRVPLTDDLPRQRLIAQRGEFLSGRRTAVTGSGNIHLR